MTRNILAAEAHDSAGTDTQFTLVLTTMREERALGIEAVEKAYAAARRYAWIRFGSEYLVWFTIGIALMFLAFHTTDIRYAKMYLSSGILIGNAGMLLVLVRLQRYAEHHGLN